jgi:hypothetical protein
MIVSYSPEYAGGSCGKRGLNICIINRRTQKYSKHKRSALIASMNNLCRFVQNPIYAFGCQETSM